MKYLSIIILALLLPFSAHALRVSNLTDAPVTFEISKGQEAPEAFTVAPHSTVFRNLGNGRLRIQGRNNDVLTSFDDHYAIWPDGTFGPQFRRKRSGRE